MLQAPGATEEALGDVPEPVSGGEVGYVAAVPDSTASSASPGLGTEPPIDHHQDSVDAVTSQPSGPTSEPPVVQPVPSTEEVPADSPVEARIRLLADQGLSTRRIAAVLEGEGQRLSHTKVARILRRRHRSAQLDLL